MARFTVKKPVLTINGVDLTDHCSHATIETAFDDVEATAFGSDFKQYLQGMGDATITLTMQQDFAAGSVDATLWPLATGGNTFPVTIKPFNTAVGPTNPRYDMTGILLSYSPLDGDVGDLSTTDIEIRNASQTGLTRNIA